jgi:hypothetical protein
MAHWAQLNDKNEVIQVTVGDNNDPNGDEGYQWLIDNLGGTWMKTSYNTIGGIHREGGTPFRKNYGSIGFVYDENRDAFIPPKPFESWILNEETCRWQTPVPMPTEGGPWIWVEEDLNWQAHIN